RVCAPSSFRARARWRGGKLAAIAEIPYVKGHSLATDAHEQGKQTATRRGGGARRPGDGRAGGVAARAGRSLGRQRWSGDSAPWRHGARGGGGAPPAGDAGGDRQARSGDDDALAERRAGEEPRPRGAVGRRVP